MDNINPSKPDLLDYGTFIVVMIGIICDILLIDTLVHKRSLRTGLRLTIMTWSICDLFYLFNTPGFVYLLLKPFGLHLQQSTTDIYILEPHVTEEPVSNQFIQLNCLFLMWLLAFTSPEGHRNLSRIRRLLRCGLVLFFVGVNVLIVCIKLEMTAKHYRIVHHIYVVALIALIFVNEFQYLRLMCEDDDLDSEFVNTSLLKINVVRIYVYNWCFVYFLKYIVAYGFHDVIGKHAAMKYFYLFTICLTLTAFLTAFYVLLYMLYNDVHFRQSLISICSLCRCSRSAEDPTLDENYVLLAGRYYQPPYYTTEVY